MRDEISAGGVVVKRKNSHILILLIQDKNQNWTFPKGLIEEGEKPDQSAKREVAEETGVKKIKLICKLSAINYYYTFEKEKIKKTVHYFLFEHSGQDDLIPQKNEGINEVKWFEIEKAKEIIGYKETNLKILSDLKKIMNLNNSPI